MTWTLVMSLTIAAYLLKALGLIFLGGRTMPALIDRTLTLLPVALLTALIVTGTIGTASGITIDARLLGVSVAAFLAWRRAPLVVIIVAAALVTAGVRMLS